MKTAIGIGHRRCRNFGRNAFSLVRAGCFLWVILTTRVVGGSAGDGAPSSPDTNPARAALGQISTRAYVGIGNGAIIAGFIIEGTQQKSLLARGLGPSLNVPDTLLDPYLVVYDPPGGGSYYNDDWEDDYPQAIINTGLPPGRHAESAVLSLYAPAAYTAVLYSHGPDNGIAIVEVYDLDLDTDSRLVNISTRARVKSGDNIMIAGFIAVGQEPLRVIVRALGPTIPETATLGDPVLELRDANGELLGLNDNWRTDQEAEIIATTIPPGDDRESALVRTLAPGAYTALVRGVNSASGLALVEVYALN